MNAKPLEDNNLTANHRILMGVVALILLWVWRIRRCLDCLASVSGWFATNRNKKQGQWNNREPGKYWCSLQQTLDDNNLTTNSAFAAIVVSVVKSNQWALDSAKNQAKNGCREAEIWRKEDGRPETLLENNWKLWWVITQQQSAGFGRDKLQSSSACIGWPSPTIGSSGGRETGEIQPKEERNSENGSGKVSDFGWG